MKKTILVSTLFIIFFTGSRIYGQPGCASVTITSNGGNNIVLPCSQNCTTLNASAIQTSGETSSYTVSSIPYNPPYAYNTGTPILVNVDDTWSSVITLPFTFCFYGNSYNQIIAGANGVISFDLTNAGGYCPWSYSTTCPSSSLPMNSIFGVFHDLHPGVGGSMYYAILGTYPCRTFVVNWYNIPMYSCTSLYATHQIVIYETSNIIEVYIQNKPLCSSWNSGNGLVGIQNSTGAVGLAAPGRNTSQWTASNEAWRFTPTGSSVVNVTWYQGATQIGTGNSVTVCPATATTYTAQATYNTCFGIPVTVSDNITVSRAGGSVSLSPSAPSICQGSSVGITASGSNTYTWAPGTGLNTTSGAVVTASPSTTTTYTVTGVTPGCTTTNTVTVAVNAQPSINNMSTSICSNGTFNIAPVNGTNGFVPTGTTYSWSAPSVGGITGTAAGTNVGNISGTLTNTTNNPINVVYTISPKTGNCTGPSFTLTVTVNPKPAISNMATTICSNTSFTLAPVNGTNGIVPTGTTYSWAAPSVTGITGTAAGSNASNISGTLTNTTADPINVLYTITPQSGICQGNSFTVTVTVNPRPTVTVPANITTCTGATVAAGTFTSSTTGTTYTWSNSNTAVGLAGSGSGNTPSFTATNNTVNPITATITVTPAANSCTGTPSTYSITVNPTFAITTPSNITACNGAPIAAINFSSPVAGTTYSWTNNNTAIGLAGSGSGNIAGFNAVNTTSNPITANITVNSTANSCLGTPASFSITVNPTPTVTVPANITLCNGAAVSATAFTSPTAGATYSWTNNNTAIGLTGSGSGNIAAFNATNTTANPISATITVTPTANNCTGTPSSYSITVNPTPTVTVPANITVCNGAAVTASTFTSPTAGTTYTWTNNNTAIGLTGSGSGNIAAFNATNTTANPITATITVTPTANNCTGTPSSYSITVNPTPTVTVPADITVCNGAAVTASSFTSPTAGATYSWTNNNTAIGLTGSGSGNIAAFNATNTTANPISATITVTPTANNCTGTPSSYSITVNPTPTVTVPSDITVCNGATVTASSFTSPTAGTTYTWTNNNTAIGLTGSGSGNIAAFNATNTTANPITATIAVTPTANNCTGTPSSYLITVNPTPTVTVPTDITVCNGAAVTASSFASPTAGATYTWTNNNTAIGLPGSGSGNIAAFNATNTTANPITATITVIPTANTCTGTPSSYSITVNPSPTVTVPTDITVCNGAAVTASSFTSPTAGASFTWTNNNTAIGLTGSGSGNIPVFNATNTTANPISATITATASANTCTGPPSSFNITVNPTPTVIVPSNITVCNGGSVATTNFSSPTGGATYTWTNSNTAIGLTASGSGNITGFTATNTTANPITATIEVTPTANNCLGTPSTYTITVNPTPTVTVPANITVCNGATVTATSFISATAGATYSWINSNTAIGLGANGSGNIASFIATNTSSNVISATITVIPTANSCTGTPSTYTITVNPSPTVTVPANITVCNGSPVAATNFTSPTSGTTYTWSNNNTTIGLAASGSGNIASFNATNNTANPITATITVTPGANSCTGTPSTYTITVNPTPTVTVPANITVCNGSAITATNFSSATPGATYTWNNNTTSIGLGATGSGNIAGFTGTNTSTAPIIATITVTPTANNCVGTPSTYTITVNPTPTVNMIPNATVCHGESVPASAFTSQTSGTTFQWANSNTSIGLAASGDGNTPSFVATNTSTSPATATITVNPSANNCPGTPSTYIITVNPLPSITFSAPPQYCHTSPAFTLGFASPAGGTYSGPGVSGGTCDPAIAGIGTHTIIYEYTNPMTGCSNTDSTQLTISGFLNITVSPNNPFICDSGSILLIASGSFNYDWQPSASLSSPSGSMVVATPSSTTTYTVLGSNPDGCMGSTTVTVGLYTVPTLSIIPDPEEGCSPLKVKFSYGPVGLIDTNAMIWNFGDISSVDNTSTLPEPTHTYYHRGNYLVYLRAHTIEGCVVTAIDSIEVFQKPTADFYNNPEVAYSDNPVFNFIDLSSDANGWEWNFGDPSSYNYNLSNLQNPTHTFSDSGTYMVQLIVYSDQSCSDTINKTVTIYPEVIIYIPNAFTPNQDGQNEIFKPVMTGIDENNYKFYIYDRWGRQLFYTQDVDTGWDGKENDKDCEPAVYVYYVYYTSVTGKAYKIRGTVTLVK